MTVQIVILGEAWGRDEERERAPFVGASGYLLTQMLSEAGINRHDCYLTNVINARPEDNKIEHFCGAKANGIKGYPALAKGKYLRAEFTPHLERLADELCEIDPNLIIAMGATAMWALTGKTTVKNFRGTTALSDRTATGFKTLATYHPAAVLREWPLRPIVVIDLEKAKRESLFPEIRRPFREIWIEPTLEDIYDFHRRYIEGVPRISIDIETSGREVTCFGIAPSPERGIVIPFHDPGRLGGLYWPSKEIEIQVWRYIRSVLEDPSISKILQNGMYDIPFLFRSYGIKVAGANEDTMLLHHALQPESNKDLGFLGATYCDEGAWKQMRGTGKKTIKRDD